MAVHATRTQTTDPTDATRSASAGPIPAQRAATDLAVRASAGCAQRPTPSVADGVRAAAAVMGWALWIMLALTMAAFLAFAPSML